MKGENRPFTDYQYVFINFPKPVIRFDISKKRVKDCVKAIGQHVKTDYIDAHVIRRYAEIIQSKTIEQRTEEAHK
ncbi:MAG: hypothetical protein HOP36_02465 [Methyloglobulus sp.]|nr:hypothetical protein [Methyloglobulus sp.]